MNLPQDIVEPERERRALLPPERPETARPPAESDPPMSDVIDPDVLDIDALLPVAFETGAARVVMGQDLADLLRSAEEKLETRSEPSGRSEMDEDVADVPVPDDVLELLAEPLENDEDDAGTGALGGGSSSGTGADRPGTLDIPHPTAHGEEEDLEQPLPRASERPHETTSQRREGRFPSARAPDLEGATGGTMPHRAARTGSHSLEPQAAQGLGASRSASTSAGLGPGDDLSRPETSVGREGSSPGYDGSRSVVTAHGITAELAEREAMVAPRSPEDPRRDRADLDAGAGYHDRGVTIDRGAERTGPHHERGVMVDRGVDRSAAYHERGVMVDRGGPMDRGGFVDRGGGSLDRGAFGERGGIDRGAALIERSAMNYRADERAPARAPASMGPQGAQGFGAPHAPDRTAERMYDRAHERPPERAPDRGSHADAARWQTSKMVSPAAMEIGDGGPKSRTPRTDAMPAVLGPGDAARALGRAIANRVSGALIVTSNDEQRRIVLHDGDVVTAGSTAPVESLVAFLAARGDLERDLVPRLSGKLPPFGRHAGAALVAHGYLGQDDLWPVLRAHAEWVMGRAILVDSGTCELEPDPPARYKAEPGVFGGATGAEVFVDAVQRVVAPEEALARLGGYGARLAPGPRTALLGECALTAEEEDAVRAAAGHTVHEFAGDGPTERWSMLHALVCLEVLDALPAVSAPKPRAEAEVDPIDDEALRARVRARLALVEEGDYFALLGVPRTATSYEIRRAYLDLRRTFEPSRILTATTVDLVDDVRLVVEVVEEAYEILRDAHRRDRYRRAIEAGPPR